MSERTQTSTESQTEDSLVIRIKQRAMEMLAFMTKNVVTGSRMIVRLSDEAPDWTRKVCSSCTFGSGAEPSDAIYEEIYVTLSEIGEINEVTDPDQLGNALYVEDDEFDIQQLTAWLATDPTFVRYIGLAGQSDYWDEDSNGYDILIGTYLCWKNDIRYSLPTFLLRDVDLGFFPDDTHRRGET